MKKSDIYLFVGKVKMKAIKSVTEKHDKIITNEQKKIYKRYDKELNEFGNAILELNRTYDNIMDKIKKDKNYKIDTGGWVGSYEIESLVKNLTSKKPTNVFDRSGISYDGKLEELHMNENKELNEVKAEYDKVMKKCRELNSAKQCVKYLNELGFDTSSIEVKKEIKIDEINTSKLFVCGENK